jgi:hypothetical protein
MSPTLEMQRLLTLLEMLHTCLMHVETLTVLENHPLLEMTLISIQFLLTGSA